MDNYAIKNVNYNNVQNALELVREVFMEFDATYYTDEGINVFIKTIVEGKEFLNKFKTGEQKMIGAYENNKLIAVLAISVRNHISLLFVKKQYHRKGVASKLFKEILLRLKTSNASKITLNATPYAIPFYNKIGFIPTDVEQKKHGITYTPMEYLIK